MTKLRSKRSGADKYECNVRSALLSFALSDLPEIETRPYADEKISRICSNPHRATVGGIIVRRASWNPDGRRGASSESVWATRILVWRRVPLSSDRSFATSVWPRESEKGLGTSKEWSPPRQCTQLQLVLQSAIRSSDKLEIRTVKRTHDARTGSEGQKVRHPAHSTCPARL